MLVAAVLATLLSLGVAEPAAGAACRAGTFDVDLDGYPDTVVGAPLADISGAVDAGRVSVLRGGTAGPYGTGAFDLTAATLHVETAPGAKFGASMAVGDFTGDGCLDLAVGAPGQEDGAGAVYVVDLSASALSNLTVTVLRQEASGVAGRGEQGDAFGTALAVTPGRVRDTLWIGAPGEDLAGRPDAGVVTSFGIRDTAGALSADVYDWSQSDFGGTSEPGDRFGAALAGGVTALVVGAPGEDLGQAADAGVFGYRLRSGAARQVRQSGSGAGVASESGDRFGATVAITTGCQAGGEAVVAGAPGEDLSGSQDAGLLVVTDLAAPTHSTAVTQALAAVDGTPEQGDQFGFALAPTGHGVLVGVPGEQVGSASAAGLVHDLVLSCTSTRLSRVASGRGLSQATRGFAGANERGDALGTSVAVTSWSTGSGRRSAAVLGVPGEDVGSVVDAGAAVLVPFASSSGSLTSSGSTGIVRGAGAPGAAQARERLADGMAVTAGGRAGTVSVPEPFRLPESSSGSSARFPGGVSASGRYFVDGAGRPWFGVGDTAWSLLGQLSPPEIDSYLSDRAARGVNLVVANLLEHYFSDHAPNNYADEPPFTGPPFQSAPNEAYWKVVDHAVAKAESLGITLLLCPAYLGYPTTDEGWDDELARVTDADLAVYGQFLGDRYGSARNVMWLIGHDRAPTATQKSRMEALAAKLPPEDMLGLSASAAVDVLGSRPWLPTSIVPDFETIYDYSSKPADATEEGWRQKPVRPVLFLEARYEQEGDFGPGDERLRHQTYGPLAAGASAVVFGNNPIWHFGSTPIFPYSGTWQQNLNSLGARDLATFGSVVAGVPWWAMVPTIATTLLPSGAEGAQVRASDTAALIYLPTRRAVTLDLARFTAVGEVDVVAVDPRSGARLELGRFLPSSAQRIPALPTNAGGAGDWVILISAGG
jgi:hypothetical protein